MGMIFSQKQKLKFLIFTDTLARDIEKILKHWQQFSKHGLIWDIRPPLYPPLTEVKTLDNIVSLIVILYTFSEPRIH